MNQFWPNKPIREVLGKIESPDMSHEDLEDELKWLTIKIDIYTDLINNYMLPVGELGANKKWDILKILDTPYKTHEAILLFLKNGFKDLPEMLSTKLSDLNHEMEQINERILEISKGTDIALKFEDREKKILAEMEKLVGYINKLKQNSDYFDLQDFLNAVEKRKKLSRGLLPESN